MTDLSDLIVLSSSPTGRRLFAHHGVLEAAKKRSEYSALVAHVTKAIAADEATLKLELEWDVVRGTPAVGSVAAVLDTNVDRLLGDIYGVAESMASVTVKSMPREAGRRLMEKAFPRGLAAVTQRTHEEECSVVGTLIAEFNGALAGDIAALGLGPVVTELEAAHKLFAAELNKPIKIPLSFDKVQAARARGQARLLETVARILGLHPSSEDEQEMASREALLAPIMKQEADIRAANKRRKTVMDVHPTTGEVVATVL